MMDGKMMGSKMMKMPPKSPMTGTVPDTTSRPRLDEMKVEDLAGRAMAKTMETMGHSSSRAMDM